MTVSDIELSRFVLMCRFRTFERELYFTDARGCACFPTIEWLKQNKSESPVMFSLSILLLIISEIFSSLRIRILLLVLFLFEWISEQQIHFDGLSRTVSLWFPGYSIDCSEILIPSTKQRVSLLRRSAFALSLLGRTWRWRRDSVIPRLHLGGS